MESYLLFYSANLFASVLIIRLTFCAKKVIGTKTAFSTIKRGPESPLAEGVITGALCTSVCMDTPQYTITCFRNPKSTPWKICTITEPVEYMGKPHEFTVLTVTVSLVL